MHIIYQACLVLRFLNVSNLGIELSDKNGAKGSAHKKMKKEANLLLVNMK